MPTKKSQKITNCYHFIPLRGATLYQRVAPRFFMPFRLLPCLYPSFLGNTPYYI